MGLFSSSKKKSKVTNHNYLFDDDVTTADYGDLDANGGTLSKLSGIKDSTVNLTVTDQGAVAKSLQLADGTFGKAFDFIDGAYSDSVDFLEKSNADGLEFLGKTNSDAFKFLSQTQEDSLDYLTGTQKDFMYYAGAALSALDESYENTATHINTNAQNAMRYVAEHTQSEQNQLFDKAASFGKWIIIAVGVLGVVGVVAVARKR